MDWGVVKLVVAILAAGLVCVMIVSMVIGAIRSTRRTRRAGKPKKNDSWSHTKDKEFLPWEDDDH